MKTTILICTLKPEVPSGTMVFLERRAHDVEFEIINPGEGVEHNVSKLCDVKVKKRILQEVSDDKPADAADDELLKFAGDAWDLAIKFEKQLNALQKKYDEISSKKAATKAATKAKPRTRTKKE